MSGLEQFCVGYQYHNCALRMLLFPNNRKLRRANYSQYIDRHIYWFCFRLSKQYKTEFKVLMAIIDNFFIFDNVF